MLHEQTQQAIASIERVSQSAIQQRLKAAGWPAVEILLKYYNETIKQLRI